MNYSNILTFLRNLFFITAIPIVSAFGITNPNLISSHKSLDFGTVLIGESKTIQVLIHNQGDSAVESINYISNCNYNFQIKSDCLEDLKPQKTCFMNITFRPREFFIFKCLAQISSNNGHLYIPIQATAAKPD